MDRLREKLNPEEVQTAVEGPTRYRTEKNIYKLNCAACGELYYVDKYTLEKATKTLEGDPSEIDFYCEDCEEEYIYEAYAR
ncbi:MAG TPA: hypothetical protein VNO14_10120 [Blastocatellia bacterium]|nr:hypothetical protein [Blastocatellia bacterium]